METELESFWEEKRKVKLQGNWVDLADHVESKYIPKPGTMVSVTVTDGKVTFLKRAGGGKPSYNKPSYDKPKEDFQEANNFKPQSSTKHVVGSGLSDEDLMATLDTISAENNVFATQTHFVDGKWNYICFIK